MKLEGFGIGSYSLSLEIRNVKKVLKKPRIIFDVGGNKGEYSKSLFKTFKDSKIYIFEPSKLNHSILIKRFKNNNVVINNVAVSDKNESSKLYFSKQGEGIASLSKRKLDHFDINFNLSEEVTVITLKKFMVENKINKIDFLKLDIEGYELNALKGLEDFIHKVDLIQFEFGGCNIDTRTFFQDFFYFFKSKNFQLYRISFFGMIKINNYREFYENFTTTNYLAVNKKF
ncbi:FkbM family methyltransferase [Flavobacteriaceae bacterium]|nr:FkbM family methyltransferase [Flavobacteriaceae bacterium]